MTCLPAATCDLLPACLPTDLPPPIFHSSPRLTLHHPSLKLSCILPPLTSLVVPGALPPKSFWSLSLHPFLSSSQAIDHTLPVCPSSPFSTQPNHHLHHPSPFHQFLHLLSSLRHSYFRTQTLVNLRVAANSLHFSLKTRFDPCAPPASGLLARILPAKAVSRACDPNGLADTSLDPSSLAAPTALRRSTTASTLHLLDLRDFSVPVLPSSLGSCPRRSTPQTAHYGFPQPPSSVPLPSPPPQS